MRLHAFDRASLLCALAAVTVGCNSTSAGDAGGQDAGGAGRGGAGGGQGGATGGHGGGAGAGGAQGGAGGRAGAGGATSCPATPPLNGSPCSGQNCFYEDCSGVGRTTALCHPEGTFEVHTTACTAPICTGVMHQTCQAGQICRELASGTVTDDCIANTCGAGPLSCACLPCAGTCTIIGNAQGIDLNCNTCPAGQQCP